MSQPLAARVDTVAAPHVLAQMHGTTADRCDHRQYMQYARLHIYINKRTESADVRYTKHRRCSFTIHDYSFTIALYPTRLDARVIITCARCIPEFSAYTCVMCIPVSVAARKQTAAAEAEFM